MKKYGCRDNRIYVYPIPSLCLIQITPEYDFPAGLKSLMLLIFRHNSAKKRYFVFNPRVLKHMLLTISFFNSGMQIVSFIARVIDDNDFIGRF